MTEAVITSSSSSTSLQRNVSFGEDVVAKDRHMICKQISIESPVSKGDSVFTADVPIPDVPSEGARIKVVCAGVCYRRRDSTIGNDSSSRHVSASSFRGFRDAALYPGYEVAGVIDEFGADVRPDVQFVIGDRVVVYPDELIPHGYADFIVVPDIADLVKVPDSVPLPVAAMLPTTALWAMNAVLNAKTYVDEFRKRDETKRVKILIVGTGGLALWAIRFAKYNFLDHSNVEITVATLKDEGLSQSDEGEKINVVHWCEGLYEKQLIERTLLACHGEVDIVIDFGTTARTLLRSLQCLAKDGGVALIGSEVSGYLIQKFTNECQQNKQTIRAIDIGSREQLQQLMDLVAEGKIKPPHYEIFPADQAAEVMKKVLRSEIHGRALLQFSDLV